MKKKEKCYLIKICLYRMGECEVITSLNLGSKFYIFLLNWKYILDQLVFSKSYIHYIQILLLRMYMKFLLFCIITSSVLHLLIQSLCIGNSSRLMCCIELMILTPTGPFTLKKTICDVEIYYVSFDFWFFNFFLVHQSQTFLYDSFHSYIYEIYIWE